MADANRPNNNVLNVCRSIFKCQVSSSAIHVDGYPPSNLCSDLSSHKGFRVESFVLPPICLCASLPQKFAITNVILDVLLEGSESMCLEIRITRQSSDLRNSKLSLSYGDSYSTLDQCTIDAKRHIASFRAKSCTELLKDVNVVGSRVQRMINESKNVCERLVSYPHELDSVIVCVKFIKGHRPLKVRNFEVWIHFHGSPPEWVKAGLKHLTANPDGAEATSSTAVSFYGRRTENGLESEVPSASMKNSDLHSELSTASEKEDSKNEHGSDVDVTDLDKRFLDELTCRLMRQPMVLPSGYYVDQVTIDRHNEHESLWGRQPSDPFTGVPYSKTNHPILDFKLKMEIDNFYATTLQISSQQRNDKCKRANSNSDICIKQKRLKYISK